jgi:hypothetical protein
MKHISPDECFFCGSNDISLPEVGIAMGMGGADYSFCRNCLKDMTADEFWRKFFDEHGWSYPPNPDPGD